METGPETRTGGRSNAYGQEILGVMLMSGVIAVCTTATQAMPAAEHGGDEQDQKSIVGSWIGINETGERWLASFTSDGIALNSVQSEVSSTRPVGVSRRRMVSGRKSGTGNSRSPKWPSSTTSRPASTRSTGKLRGVLTLDKTGDALSGSVTADAFGPDGTLVFTLTHTLRFTRIKVEAVD